MRPFIALCTLASLCVLAPAAGATPPPQASIAAQVAALPMPTVTRRLKAHRAMHARVARLAQALGLPVKAQRQALVVSAR